MFAIKIREKDEWNKEKKKIVQGRDINTNSEDVDKTKWKDDRKVWNGRIAKETAASYKKIERE